MELIKKTFLFFKKHPILTLGIFYFVYRLPNLTLLPIFNDEAIYLDWGWRETHSAGLLYYSLYDAKQPFMMWLFGIFSNFFSNPLYAGRFVSLLLGFLSTIGIYYIGKEIFNRKIGFLSALIYIVVPIFVLFDRQALLESAVITSNIWSFYFLNKALGKKRYLKYEILTGVALGLGFFSKSTATLFLITTAIILTFYFFKTRMQIYILRLGVIILSFLCIILLLLINPQFWHTLPSNSRYILTTSELLKFPVSLWMRNIWGMLQINFFFATPFVFLFAVFAIYDEIQKRRNLLLLVWPFIPVLIALLTLREISQRYIVSLLPILTILSSLSLIKIIINFKKIGIIITILFFLVPVSLSLLLIYNPLKYFLLANSISPYSEMKFVDGYTSGYGIEEVIDYIKNENKKNPLIVTYAENSGNPESAMSVLFAKEKIMNGYFEMKFLGTIPQSTQCIEITSGKPMYFISRDNQTAGFDKYIKKIKTIHKPISKDTIGIYKFISGCQTPLKVNPVFQG